MSGRRESLPFPDVPDIGATPSQIQRWDAEDAYNRMFGAGGHVDSAHMETEYIVEAAKDCILTGVNGALWFYNHAMTQLRAARQINSAALKDGLFRADQAGEHAVRIMEAEKKIRRELEAAILQGCPCVK